MMTLHPQRLRIEVRDYYDNPQYELVATCNLDGTIAGHLSGTSSPSSVFWYSSFLSMVNVYTQQRLVLIIHNNI